MKKQQNIQWFSSEPIDYFKKTPLIHCLTNEVTCESMANALLYVNSKPIMAVDPREFQELFKQSDALLLNLGHISKEREEQISLASEYSLKVKKPTVVDVVGVSASSLRKELALKLLANQPMVVKGNTSEMRSLCGLSSHGRGVDGHVSDQSLESLKELSSMLKEWTIKYPHTSFLATGEVDVIVTKTRTLFLKNGVAELDKITGTGDMVGALIASLLAQGQTVQDSLVGAISYFNLCGENAKKNLRLIDGMENFRIQLFNELSLLHQRDEWFKEIKGEWL